MIYPLWNQFVPGLGNVYTFGPCFRAEKSDTNRHLAEFWMVEVELMRVTLCTLMDFAESYVRYCIQQVLMNCSDELNCLEKIYSSTTTTTTTTTLKDKLKLMDQPFIRMNYNDAIKIIGVPFGIDLLSDQEK